MTNTAATPVVSPSLEGVVVGEMQISHVDGDQGALIYRGYDIAALTDRPVFHALGIPAHFFTGLFAMARVYGYIAHYAEFMQEPRLIRPRARYVGVKR